MPRQFFLFFAITIFLSCKKSTPIVTPKIPAVNSTVADVKLDTAIYDSSRVNLSWSQSPSSSFNSYSLYRHTSSGINPTTGQLIHVATNVNELTFQDKTINTGSEYFYRIYVQAGTVNSGGSNIVSLKVPAKISILNPNFESIVNNKLANWNVVDNSFGNPLNSIEIDNVDAQDGKNSLKFHHEDTTGCYEQWIDQYIPLSEIQTNTTYDVSFYYKSDFNGGSGNVRLKNNDFRIEFAIPKMVGDGVWRKFQTQIVTPNNLGSTSPQFMIHFCNQGKNNWWIDTIKITGAL